MEHWSKVEPNKVYYDSRLLDNNLTYERFEQIVEGLWKEVSKKDEFVLFTNNKKYPLDYTNLPKGVKKVDPFIEFKKIKRLK